MKENPATYETDKTSHPVRLSNFQVRQGVFTANINNKTQIIFSIEAGKKNKDNHVGFIKIVHTRLGLKTQQTGNKRQCSYPDFKKNKYGNPTANSDSIVND